MEGAYNVRVEGVRVASANVREFFLVREGGGELPPFAPGAHISVSVPNGQGSTARAYSLILPVEREDAYRIAVRLDPEGQGGSRFMHEEVRPGSMLQISGPRNRFELDTGIESRLFIAGGIGITPIMTMAHHAHARNEPFRLHYVARSSELMPFRSELINAFGDRVFLYFDEGRPEEGLNLRQLLDEHAGRGPIYVCGPAGMIDATLRIGEERQLRPGVVRYERFNSTMTELSGNQPFEVVLARSGCSVLVRPSQTILEAVLDAGIEVAHDCRVGECGACVTSVKEGEPDHRDAFLNRKQLEAGDVMCICVSRARGGRLVLDL